MEIEITRHGLQIIPTNQPIDDIVIEEVLGLCAEGHHIRLVRVAASRQVTIPSYVLETNSDVPKEAAPPVESAAETAEKILEKDENWETQPEPKPLPCPFCGAYPEIILLDTDDPGIICGKIVCLNSQCSVQPEICDDRRLPDSAGEKPFRSGLISQWNTRPANVKPS